MSNEVTVLDAMKKADKPVRTGDIVDLSGLDRKEVEKAMKQLKAENKIVSPKRCFWEPAK
ncbi:transcriptional regulator [Carboxylicivirga sediminis]|uniref:Transcriptional regulator n=1 Tax=Carboxylicivirga sediminis TaxID=2006564 RepID=A0A941IZ35_9BACT|nr:transcriptional regulator [Carboxylicivirga sediminis]MBR8536412.1 transcriptional regulator [Carboxylicivirga sediminis]